MIKALKRPSDLDLNFMVSFDGTHREFRVSNLHYSGKNFPPATIPLPPDTQGKHLVLLLDFDGTVHLYEASAIPKGVWLCHLGWLTSLPDGQEEVTTLKLIE